MSQSMCAVPGKPSASISCSEVGWPLDEPSAVSLQDGELRQCSSPAAHPATLLWAVFGVSSTPAVWHVPHSLATVSGVCGILRCDITGLGGCFLKCIFFGSSARMS